MTREWYRFFSDLVPLTVTTTLDFPNTALGTVSDLTIAVPNAVVGAPVRLGVPAASVPAAGTFFAWVSAADVVTVRYANNSTTTAYNPASGDFTVSVDKV